MYMIVFILLILWSILGSFDAAYYHDKKYSFKERPIGLTMGVDCKFVGTDAAKETAALATHIMLDKIILRFICFENNAYSLNYK